MDTLGLYFHIPFCKRKCPYCDFYSLADKSLHAAYKEAVCEEIKTLSRCREFAADAHKRTVDTVYFGGGTPSEWGAENIRCVLQAVKEQFPLAADAEITVECNPSTPDLQTFFAVCAESGVNRISMGMQSAVDSERKKLGRRANAADVKAALYAAKNAGISDCSLDLMIGIPDQTAESLQQSLQFLVDSQVPHASVYLLSVEEGTFFHKNQSKLNLPDEDTAASFYLQTVDFLNNNGLQQYEISNFARPGYESRHNTRYWEQKEYLGIGPAAHSFLNGKRFGFTRDIHAFLQGQPPVFCDDGGDFEEYVMLRLRLVKGLTQTDCRQKFGIGIPPSLLQAAAKYEKLNLIKCGSQGIQLTPQGFLVSNMLIADLLGSIDPTEVP